MPIKQATRAAKAAGGTRRLEVSLADDPADLLGDIRRLFVDPDAWLNTPHPELEEHRPVEFLEAGREQPLRDLIAGIKYGLFA